MPASGCSDNVDAAEVLAQLYNCKASRITRLSGYDDLNFLVELVQDRDADDGKRVLKIVNEADSNRSGLTEAIAAVLDNISSIDFAIPRPVRCSNGEYVGTIKYNGILRNVVLLSFVPGLNHKELRFESRTFLRLWRNIGACAGTLAAELFKIRNSPCVLKRTADQYMMSNLYMGRKKLSFVGDKKAREVCSEVMDIAEAMVSSATPDDGLRKGVIHNDLCLENLVFDVSSEGEYVVSGAIDFSDMTFTCCVFEVAIPMASAMRQTYFLKEICPYDAAKSVLDGFQEHFPLGTQEKAFLYHAVLIRFVSLCVIGGYDVLHNPLTAEHEERGAVPLEYFIKLMWNDGKEKWQKVLGL